MRFIHNPDKKSCVGYMPDNEAIHGTVFRLTQVLCHKNDTYKKTVAREMIRRNFEAGQFIKVRIPKGDTPSRGIHYIVSYFSPK